MSVSAVFGLVGCGSAREGGGAGGSRIEIEWLEPPPDGANPDRPSRPGVVPTSPELGDGSAASEAIAGARRLLGLAIDADGFVRHVLAGTLVDTPKPAPNPAVGDIARGANLVAVVERVDGDGGAGGDGLVLVGLRDGDKVTRWTRSARGLRFERP